MEDIEEDRGLVYGRNESMEDIEEDRGLVYGRNERMEDFGEDTSSRRKLAFWKE